MTAPSAPRLPRYTGGDMSFYLDRLCYAIEALLGDLAVPAGVYTTVNVSPVRTLDASADTLAVVRNVLGTLIQDAQNRGVLG